MQIQLETAACSCPWSHGGRDWTYAFSVHSLMPAFGFLGHAQARGTTSPERAEVRVDPHQRRRGVCDSLRQQWWRRAFSRYLHARLWIDDIADRDVRVGTIAAESPEAPATAAIHTFSEASSRQRFHCVTAMILQSRADRISVASSPGTRSAADLPSVHTGLQDVTGLALRQRWQLLPVVM